MSVKTAYVLQYEEVNKSDNIKQDFNKYVQRLITILPKIVSGCQDGFNNCSICQADYSVQFLDIAICILYEDSIIDRKTYNDIMQKLYDGHRG